MSRREKVKVVYVKAPEKPNHVLHLLLSVITLGLWVPVWFLISFMSAIRRKF